MNPNEPADDEATDHARAVFARMAGRRRVPLARRARGQGEKRPRQAALPQWESGQDKALPPGDRD